jgi:tetratricopeptide (TPR) repeat protein
MKNILLPIILLSAVGANAQIADSAQHYFDRGAAEKTAKRYLAASKKFDSAIKINPKFTAAYIENGFTNLEMRKMDAAIINFTKAHELEPANLIPVKELMHLHFAYRQYPKAVEMAQQCNTCDGAEKVIAMSYYQQEDYGRAEKAILALLKKTPADGELNYTLGRTYLELENEKSAIAYYDKAIQFDTTKAAWYQELGLLYYNTNRYKEAVVCFNKAADRGFTQSNDFRENLAFAYLYSGQFEPGEKIIDDLMVRKGGNKSLLMDVADAYYQMRQYDKALTYCQKMLEQNEKDGPALYRAGMCFIKKGQKDRGQAMCDKAIEYDPSLGRLKTQQNMGIGL